MQIVIILAAAILGSILIVLLHCTRFGKAIRAVGDDALAAAVVGVRLEKTIAMTVALGSAVAGASGVLMSFETGIEPSMGMAAILKAAIAAIIGGLGKPGGAVAGGLFLGIVENLGVWQVSSGWKDCIAFALLIIFLLLRPRGFCGDTLEATRS
jgi:branched-chain amino acid transport system permease protein